MHKKYISVIWKDAVSWDDWTHKDNIKPIFATIVTLGELIGEDDDGISIALNHDTLNNNHSCIMHIPKKWIVKMTEVKVSRKSVSV